MFDRGAQPAGAFPWGALAMDSPAFCTLWTTGPDTSIDGVFRIQARRKCPESGEWEEFDRYCDPFRPEEDDERERAEATARMVREFGVTGRELDGQPPASDVWPALETFLGSGPVLVVELDSFEAWAAHLAASSGADREASLPRTIGLVEAASLLHPGRLAGRRENLVRDLLAPPGAGGVRTVGPRELQAAWTELVARFVERDEAELGLVTSGYLRAWAGLSAPDPRTAAGLELVLELADRPSTWRSEDEGLLPFRAPPPDGRLRASIATDVPVEQRFDAVLPRCATEGARWRQAEAVPPDARAEMPFDDEDRRALDEVFEVHLPKLFARDRDTEPQYRESQHQVARAVADALGARELLLVHAPTGTGKTIAYLVPALLWARRHGVRVGVATYTRALQEQAMDREVPRVLASLAAAGIGSGFRVSVLKGRENYLCWRALRNALPTDEDDGETWLAWTTLALFGLTDPDGDLNRLPRRAPLSRLSSAASGLSGRGSSGGTYVRALTSLARQARGETGCCRHKEDRETCAAEVSRRKAERSHVVITNQAFALLRPEFFKHLVFDECEHLHDQAHSVFSDSTSLRKIRGLFGRLHQPERDQSRAPLDRLDRALLANTPSKQDVERALSGWQAAQSALTGLERAVEGFEGWRASYARGRQTSDEHSLLREFCTAHDAVQLIESRCRFVGATGELSAAVAALAERLDGTQVPLRGKQRIRRQLELARAELEEVLGVVQRWIPVKDGRASFPPRTFHDVERDARGELVLAARVLLPNEFLGRHVYPDLGCGVLLSATTWLGQSFDPALRYLGLDRVANPADDSDQERERPARSVRTFRSPEVFDYSRVVVATPRDAPSPRLGKDATLDYVRRFLAYLGERTRGRILCLFTNAQDARRVGRELEGFFRARRIPFWYQNMEGTAKEELGELFRGRTDSILLGLDTFWYGADFPGETLEYLVIVKLPYGVPDRYHHAQCAALGTGEQRKRIYMPRALAKLRQGFGRLMRRTSDKGCVFLLDPRVLEPRHRDFLRELPLDTGFSKDETKPAGARVVRGDTDHCVREALAHMEMLADVRRRGLEWSFSELLPNGPVGTRRPTEPFAGRDMPPDQVRERPAMESHEEPGQAHETAAEDNLVQRQLPSERPVERPDVPLEDLPF